MSTPFILTLPEVGNETPVKISKVVVLPAPLIPLRINFNFYIKKNT